MLRTILCDLYGIEHPIILAPMGSATSAEFAAAVSNAGGLGSIGTLRRSTEAILRDLETIQTLTDHPFAVNHIPQSLNEAAFAETLRLRPTVVSFALGDPGELIDSAHDVGALVQLQVTTVAQAVAGVERGVDVIVAQGAEAGGFGGVISTLALVPQVVDAVAPIPVVAAGGIFDGRGLAAALMLGAVGVNIGTRFVASAEAPIDDGWRQAIVTARSEDAIKADVLNALDPNPGAEGFGTVLRSLRTPFLDEWNSRLDEASARRDQLLGELKELHESGRSREVVLTAGQSAGAITEVLPVAEIIRRLIDEAETALQLGLSLVRSGSESARDDRR
jgi:nitronate monooxygenase/enoyl-[acyl-carrier protein] reductase II